MAGQPSNTSQAFWAALGSFSSFMLAIVSAMILSRYFDKTEYGTYRQIFYVYTTLLIVFTAGLPRVYAYFLPRYSVEQGRDIVLKVTKVLFLAGMAFSLFLFAFAKPIAILLDNEAMADGLRLFSPVPMFLLPTLGIEGVLSAYKKTMYIAMYNTITRLVMLLCIVFPVVALNGSYIMSIYGWLAASVLSLVICFRFFNIPFKGIKSQKTDLDYKQIFAYCVPLAVASLWGLAIRSADQFFISRFFGVEVFADYSNGFIEIPFVAMVTASVSLVLMPVYSKIIAENKGTGELVTLWQNSMRKSAIIIYPIVIFFIAFGAEIMTVLFSDKYETSGVYFQINMFLNFFNIIIFAPLFLAMGKTKVYSNIHLVLAILVWATHYCVVLVFNSPVAVAVNSTFFQIVKIMVFIALMSKYLKIPFLQFFPLRALAALVLQCGIVVVSVKALQYYLVPDIPEMVSLVLYGALYAVLLLATAKLFKNDYFSLIKPLVSKFK